MRRALLLIGLLVFSGQALAQSPACQSYRAQLASLDSGGGQRAAAMAQRQRQELNQMYAYRQRLGCERGPFAIFGPPPPPECHSTAQRVQSMEANYARLAQQAASASPQQRQALLAAIQQHCGSGNEPRQRSLFESLFGPSEPPVSREVPQILEEEDGQDPGLTRVGRGRPVCVRSCDGYFFPLPTTGGGRSAANDLCQALCPGTETQLYYVPGDSDLRRAVSVNGKPYTDLPNAFRFRTKVDSSCSCRKPGESWVAALARAEEMIERGRNDIIVTAQKAEELSRPKDNPASRKDRREAEKVRIDPEAAKAAADGEVETREAAEAGAAAPTASEESAGIGPQNLDSAKVLGRETGPRKEVETRDGRRSVRIVAPNVIPVPSNNKL